MSIALPFSNIQSTGPQANPSLEGVDPSVKTALINAVGHLLLNLQQEITLEEKRQFMSGLWE